MSRRRAFGAAACGLALAACADRQPPEAGELEPKTPYQRLIADQIYRKLYYPKWLVDARKVGIVHLLITIGSDGELLEAKIAYSTERLLNNIALGIVRAAAPFPPFPPEQTGSRLTLIVPIVFRLVRA